MKQPALAKNAKRNARRNQRIGRARDIIKLAKSIAVCGDCGIKEPLVFYCKHRNITFNKFLEGHKSLKSLKRNLQHTPVYCLNHAALRRKHIPF